MRTSTERGIALITTLLVMMLISALLVGFTAIVMSDQRYRFIDRDRGQAFYAASGAMEKLTADLGNMFFANLAPTSAQVTALTATTPVIAGITYGTTTAPSPLPASMLSTYTCGPSPLVPVTKGTMGYTIMFCTNATGNPVPAITAVIKTGAYAGLSAAQTPYQLDVTARTAAGGEVHLSRTIEAVAIPVFQFGMFSDIDLSFFAGPNFNFGGRVATNGNLFLAEGAGNTLTLTSQVTAVGEVILQQLQNGGTIASNGSTGTISLAKSPGVFRTLAVTEGSLVNGLGSAYNEPTWHTISLSTYNSYIRNSRTGAKNLSLPLITAGGSNPDLVRRPLPNENTTNPQLYGERLFPKASLRILLSDTAADITGLPGVTATAPISLDSNWNTTVPYAGWAASALTPPIARSLGPLAAAVTLSGGGTNVGDTTISVNAVPAMFFKPQITAKNAAGTTIVGPFTCDTWNETSLTGCHHTAALTALWTLYVSNPGGSATLGPGNMPGNANPSMILKTGVTVGTGKTLDVSPGTTWAFAANTFWVNDVGAGGSGVSTLVTCSGVPIATKFTGCTGVPAAKNNATITTSYLSAKDTGTIGGFVKIEKQDTTGAWTDITAQILGYGIGASNSQALLSNGNGAAAGTANADGQVCADPTPNALIRIQRLRDNVGGTPSANGGGCNYTGTANPYDYWPNALFDPREGLQREFAPAGNPAGTNVILGGVMYYIAIDAQNVAKWFMGTAPYNAAPYLPNGTNAIQNNTGFTVYFSDRRNNRNAAGLETGEYGYEDVVNPLSGTGVPNGTLDTGEDVNGNGVLDVYGQVPNYLGVVNSVPPPGGLAPLNVAATPVTSLNPGVAQVNRSILFRHALMLMDAQNLRPLTGIAGLTVVSENPVYMQGDWNANDTGNVGNNFNGNGFTGLNAATSVLADSVSLLSNDWVDAVSFTQPYNNGGRAAVNPASYRLAIAAGKGMAFPWPSPGGPAADFGTDGGAHNFLRLLENWSGNTLNYSGSIATFYYSRQAVGTYKGGVVYQPPNRAFAFDVNFSNPALLPPNTPVFRDMNAVGFSQEIRPGR